MAAATGAERRLNKIGSLTAVNCNTFAQLIYDFYKVFYRDCFFVGGEGENGLNSRGSTAEKRKQYAECIVENFDKAQRFIHEKLQVPQKEGQPAVMPDWLSQS
uniref:Uncharacterized protein n=1 Tax=Chromera velia CCMP2878 TaxID=1169474 RepID=A0A0K6S9S2_9ALVE|eukprot:Cvel_8641.t1-p1 / transcript=Cvel_8641.t1 / gene=Cvel_8641 / organism=Chromera_velia_CCMP2878 / gene_product=hypothetical protein / transcript_product=hypothetical protein / location=Cvel_scaffold481:57134-57876(-) / protein_length=102 / sequence_SO=supercontig / SO=protein_coding / is_pseudo=false